MHWLKKVEHILESDYCSLFDLMRLAGGDPLMFYRGVDTSRLNVTLDDIARMYIPKTYELAMQLILQAPRWEERFFVIVDTLMTDFEIGITILDRYADRSTQLNTQLDTLGNKINEYRHYVMLKEMLNNKEERNNLYKDMKDSTILKQIEKIKEYKIDETTLAIKIFSSVSSNLPSTRLYLYYYMIIYVSKYKLIKMFLKEKYERDPIRFQVLPKHRIPFGERMNSEIRARLEIK